jgi:hypothetical protein
VSVDPHSSSGSGVSVIAARGGVILTVRVVPRASRSAVDGVRNGALLVRLRAAPVDGAANDELLALVAEVVGVARRQVALDGGARARLKRVRIANVSREMVLFRLAALTATAGRPSDRRPPEAAASRSGRPLR